jgi:quercetin dioxygenase-like cupin family protein
MKTIFGAAVAVMLVAAPALAKDYPATVELLKTDKTILGEPITYPGSDVTAEIHSHIVVMKVGEKTSWHKHGVPLYVHVLKGTVSVEYAGHGTKVYKPGDTFMEAMDVWHQATNVGADEVQILTVFMGGNGQPQVIHKPDQ